MSKNDKLALVTPVILPPAAEREAKSLISPQQSAKITKAKFILAMPPRERELLISQIHGVHTALMMREVSGLALGAYLTNIQEITKKSRTFTKVLRLIGGVSTMTARRYMDGFKNCSVLPTPVVKAMVLKGMTITPTPGKPLGKYTNAVRIITPPKSEDPERVIRYVNQIEDHVKQTRSRQTKARINKSKTGGQETAIGDPEQLLESTFRTAWLAANKLPNNVRTKRRFLDALVGMLLTHLNIQSPQQFAPEAIPESFIPKRGRPTLVEKGEPVKEAVV